MLSQPLLQPVAPSPLDRIDIIVADADQSLAHILRSMLGRLGLKHVRIARDGNTSLELMRQSPPDILITDWPMAPMDGIALLHYLRHSPDSPNPLLPVIMLTTYNEQRNVEAARDEGVTEYVLIPFTARSVFQRIAQIIEFPRKHVIAPGYIGPDRRHREKPPEAGERRKFTPQLVSKTFAVPGKTPKEAKLILPDFTLREKLGMNVHIHDLVTPQMLEDSDQELRRIEDKAVQWLRDDAQTLEQLHAELSTYRESQAALGQMQNCALAIKTRAAQFGYTRAAEIAASLHRFCHEAYDAANASHLLIIEKHIQALTALFFADIKGSGGTAGNELHWDLQVLVNKYGTSGQASS